MDTQYAIKRTNSDDELLHYGIKGMKWGVRRYMNADGSLTPAGKKRYGDDTIGRAKLAVKSARKEYNKAYNKAYNYSAAHPISQYTKKKRREESDRRWEDAIDKADKLNKTKSNYKQIKAENKDTKKGLSARQKTAIKVGAAAAGTALTAYGAYKVRKLIKEKAYMKNLDRGMNAVNKLLKEPNNHISTKMGIYKKDEKFIDNLMEDSIRYAKRHSATTSSAVKTLINKNREFTTAELLNMGLNVIIPDYTPLNRH